MSVLIDSFVLNYVYDKKKGDAVSTVPNITVDPRVSKRHPEIAESDAKTAWRNRIEWARREGWQDDVYVAVGFDGKQRLLEVVAVKTGPDAWHIFHSMKATTKTLLELKMIESRKK